MRECDLIIYDLHSGNPHDVKLALEALKKGALKPKEGEDEKEKVLILISSLMAWTGTPRKIKPEEVIEPEKPKTPSEQSVKEAGDTPNEPVLSAPESEKYESEDGEGKEKETKVEEVDDKTDELLENFLPKKVRTRPEYIPFTEDDY